MANRLVAVEWNPVGGASAEEYGRVTLAGRYTWPTWHMLGVAVLLGLYVATHHVGEGEVAQVQEWAASQLLLVVQEPHQDALAGGS